MKIVVRLVLNLISFGFVVLAWVCWYLIRGFRTPVVPEQQIDIFLWSLWAFAIIGSGLMTTVLYRAVR